MSVESVDIYVTDDDVTHTPLPGVLVRVFDSTGTTFVTSATTDSAGRAALSLTAPATYQARFFKEQVSFPQPQLLQVLEAPVAPATNIFDTVAHKFKPPEALNPRLCRASGFFKRPDGSAAVGHDIHIHAKFDPLLLDGAALLTEQVHQRTDHNGYMQVDLVRFGQYEVTVEGYEDCLRIITIPDAPSVNLPDLLFPVVSRVEFTPAGPWNIVVGDIGSNDFPLVPVVHTTDGGVLPATATMDVAWSTSDPTIAVVLATHEKLFLRGLRPGTTSLQATRLDTSIVRIPNTPIQGVPVAFTAT